MFYRNCTLFVYFYGAIEVEILLPFTFSGSQGRKCCSALVFKKILMFSETVSVIHAWHAILYYAF